jgi:hypothetical protein
LYGEDGVGKTFGEPRGSSNDKKSGLGKIGIIYEGFRIGIVEVRN